MFRPKMRFIKKLFKISWLLASILSVAPVLGGENPTIRIAKPSGDQKFLEMPLETYLIGLIHGEINANWPTEAIKAQAVAARTYALYRKAEQRRKKRPFDLETSTADQVYAGSKGKEKDEQVEQAIATTRGEVLWYLGLYPAYFHSCCGGQTEPVSKVWGRSEVSQGVIDPYCVRAPQARWELVMGTGEFLQILQRRGIEGKEIIGIRTEPEDYSPRNALVEITTDREVLFLKATDLREMIGFAKLKSTWFTVTTELGRLIFRGKGYGHGVGMCQWGAYAMAKKGSDYKTILEFYYPKAVIKKLYE